METIYIHYYEVNYNFSYIIIIACSLLFFIIIIIALQYKTRKGTK